MNLLIYRRVPLNIRARIGKILNITIADDGNPIFCDHRVYTLCAMPGLRLSMFVIGGSRYCKLFLVLNHRVYWKGINPRFNWERHRIMENLTTP